MPRSAPSVHRMVVALAVTVATVAPVAACNTSPPSPGDRPASRHVSPEAVPATVATPGRADDPTTSLAHAVEPDAVVVDPERVLAQIDPRVLGTNVPAWLGRDVLADDTFRALTVALGTTLLRLPGGSWSNHYHWLACEERDPDGCHWTWAATPSELLDFVEATGLDASWTVAINGTAEEAAALVAWANGDVDDERPIGVDRRGNDWSTVGEWARHRAAERGRPEPFAISFWEVGNEIYGAIPAAGPECAPFGWEAVWTCDPVEYVEGTEEHDGYLAFRDAMKAVDPTIRLGIVGVGDPGSWGSWGDRVMATAPDAIDVYVIHHYTADRSVDPFTALEAPRLDWPRMADDIRLAFARHGVRDDVEIAVTEHNMVSTLEGDGDRQMPTALNAFHLAETIGQLVVHAVPIANQWNLANGTVDGSSDYGLIDTSAMRPTPAYFAMTLWSRMGVRLVHADVGEAIAAAGLRVYATTSRSGRDVHLLAINPTIAPLSVDVSIAAVSDPPPRRVLADVVSANSLDARTVTFNGVDAPAPDLGDAPSSTLPPPIVNDDGSVRFTYEVPALSMVVLHVVR